MRGKTGGKEQKRIRARAVAVPVLTVARPRNQCCTRGRRDAQVGVRPRRMPPFPQPAFASPFFPRAPLSPGLRGELCVTGRSARQAWPGPGAQPEGRGPLSAGLGVPGDVGRPAGLWRASLGVRGSSVPLLPALSLYSRGLYRALRSDETFCFSFLSFLLMGPEVRVFCSVGAAATCEKFLEVLLSYPTMNANRKMRCRHPLCVRSPL